MQASRRVLALASVGVALLAGCGARTGLHGVDAAVARDAAVSRDAGVAHDGDVSFDAAPPPSRCVVPATSTAIAVDGAPGFVFSLAPLPSTEPGGPSYVLAAAHGWSPDERLTLHLLDDALADTTRFRFGAHFGTAQFDARAGELVATVGGGDDPLTVDRFALGAGEPSRIASETLCARGCDPGWEGPAVASEVRAVVAGDPAGVGTTAYVLPRAAGAPPVVVGGLELRLGEVVALDGELVVLGARDDGLAIAHVTFDGVVSSAAHALSVPLVPTRFGVARYRERDVLVAAAVRDRGLVLLDVRDDAVVNDVTVDAAVVVPNGASIAMRGDLAAVAWGEQVGRGRVGAHLAVVDLRDGSLFMPPTVVSTESRDFASYTIWVAVAPHADGFAVVWGAWEPVTFYGVYGKVVRCPG